MRRPQSIDLIQERRQGGANARGLLSEVGSQWNKMPMARTALAAAISRICLIEPCMPPQAIRIDDHNALSPWDDESEISPLR